MITYLTAANSKYRERYGSSLRMFGLPAYRARSGKLICRGAKECVHGCYARQGWYKQILAAGAARERNLALALSRRFVPTMHAEIQRSKVLRFVRLHDSGDFYSDHYFNSWLRIVRDNPQVTFFAYTKVVPLMRWRGLPANLLLVASEGGKWDHLIDRAGDAVLRVFPLAEAMAGTGFVNITKGDDLACLQKGVRHLGAIYHGKPGRWFATDGSRPSLFQAERKR